MLTSFQVKLGMIPGKCEGYLGLVAVHTFEDYIVREVMVPKGSAEVSGSPVTWALYTRHNLILNLCHTFTWEINRLSQ